jgi:threonine dehydrogenase-like Zn-dependent dehydrogenase
LIRVVEYVGELRVSEHPEPEPGEAEAVIRLRVGGICNTDMELMAGYRGFSGGLGHEFVGDVVAGPPEWLGRRVVGEINVACGDCDLCQRGMPTHCRNRRVLGIADYYGAFADRFCLPVRNLVPVPDGVPDRVAVFTEPLAAACQVLETAHIHPTDRVVVVGAGKLGMLVAQVLRLTGCNLAVVTRRDRQKALLAEVAIQAAAIGELEVGVHDVVVDCTGSPEGFAAALALVRPRGIIVLKSTYAGMTTADLTQIAVKEITVVGSRCGSFPPAIRLLERELVHVAPLVDACFKLSDAVEAFHFAARPGVLKVLLEP